MAPAPPSMELAWKSRRQPSNHAHPPSASAHSSLGLTCRCHQHSACSPANHRACCPRIVAAASPATSYSHSNPHQCTQQHHQPSRAVAHLPTWICQIHSLSLSHPQLQRPSPFWKQAQTQKNDVKRSICVPVSACTLLLGSAPKSLLAVQGKCQKLYQVALSTAKPAPGPCLLAPLSLSRIVRWQLLSFPCAFVSVLSQPGLIRRWVLLHRAQPHGNPQSGRREPLLTQHLPAPGFTFGCASTPSSMLRVSS